MLGGHRDDAGKPSHRKESPMVRKRVWSVGLFLVLVVTMPANAAGDPPAQPGRVLDLRVIEREGEMPVAGVAVESLPGRINEPAFRGMTDDQGRCSVPVPPDVETKHHFAIRVWRDGFVSVRVLWGHTQDFEFEGVPTAYTVILDRGTPIGGIVRDEQGRPIAGARVFPSLGSRRSELEYLGLPWNTSFTTDAQGRWGCAILPASWETGELSFRVEHPHFVSSGRGYDRPLPIKELRAQTATMVMQTGFTLRGTVTDPTGKPIAGATVVWLSADEQGGGVRVKSGPDGRFQFESRPPGISLITAEVPGLATDVKQVQVGPPDPKQGPPLAPAGSSPPPAAAIPSSGALPVAPAPLVPVPVPTSSPSDAKPLATDLPISPAPVAVIPAMIPSDARQLAKDGPCEPPLVFRLGPGRTIRGRVVDTKGRPVVGARVTPEFRGCSDLLGWQGVTDAEGRFQWTNAPNEVDVLNVNNLVEGQMIRCSGPGARDNEIVVTMPAPFRLRGKVVDAETGQPIDRFRIIEGLVWTHDFDPEDKPPVWSARRSDALAGGRYEVRFPRLHLAGDTPDDYALLVIRVEAEGYDVAVSPPYHVTVGEQTCDFALRKHPWIIGTVRSPDGSLAAGAEVVVAVKGQPVPGIHNGRLAEDWNGDSIRTGPDGRYAFARPDAGGRVVIVSDRGLAQRTIDELAAGPDVTLEPWGRIRGQLRVGTGPGARRTVGARLTEPDYRGEPVVPFTARTVTDAEGRFQMDRVAPGHAMVYRPHWSADNVIYRSHRQGVDVIAGQTAEVLMGGTGRPVIGRVTRATGLPAFDLAHVKGQIRLGQPPPEFPEGFDDWDAERQRAWWYAFYKTEDGRRYEERGSSYAVKVHLDGSFRLDDVPEGHYWLQFVYETESIDLDPNWQSVWTRFAAVETYLDVPAGPDDKPLDLGTLTLTPPEPQPVDR
jgi:hypothetical protein